MADNNQSVEVVTQVVQENGEAPTTQSKVSAGLDGGISTKDRRRKPKKQRFLRGMLIYVAIFLLVIGAFVAVAWRYAEMWETHRAEYFMDGLVLSSDRADWQQMLRRHLPDTYPEYEDGSALAYDILSPALSVGKVSYIKLPFTTSPTYTLFSDGVPFATMTLRDVSGGAFGLSDWEIDSMVFYREYFTTVDFPTLNVTVPEGAVLCVNGVEIRDRETEAVAYPAISVFEAGTEGLAKCTKYTFDDIYFSPRLSATLDGVELQLVSDGGDYYFLYPKSATHTLKLTAPVGIDVYVGGVRLDESVASREEIDGELGELDDGGTGTLPRLSVWTIDGLFGDVEVYGEVSGKAVAIKSASDGEYVFETPEDCKYTVTVILPSGAELYINGTLISPDRKVTGGASAEELALGFTALGKYEVSELGVVDGAVPQFDKYVINGYLALPNIEAKMNGESIEMAGMSVNAYSVRCDFDFAVGDKFDEARAAQAADFTRKYLEYICDGGAWLDPANKENFEANYAALKAAMVEGTSGYVGVMESYRDVNKMPKYDSFTLDSSESDKYVIYSDKSQSCRVSFKLTRTRTEGGVTVSDTLEGSMMVLLVFYENEWRVWSFIYSES